MKVHPLHDRLVVRRIEEKETAKGGIIIPDAAKEKPQEGEVLAVGNGKLLENGTKIALDVKVGNKILFGKYTGTDIKIDGEEVLILLSLLDDPNKIPLQGVVAWINPAHSTGNRPQGIGVQLHDSEVGRELCKKVEGLLAGALQSSRPTHTI